MNNLQELKKTIEPLRQQLITHELFQQMKTLNHLKIFMEHHVYAVWDFMSLLKSLQRKLTCVEVPWIPVGNPDTRYLINEIVIGEESDVNQYGERMSHFELYLNAMQQANCNFKYIDKFISNLKDKNNTEEALKNANVPNACQAFVKQTFKIIQNNNLHIQAAVFTFGREDLIPDMFLNIVHELNKHDSAPISIFEYYLKRHIEVDGGHHSHLAYQMTENLCGGDKQKWKEATTATQEALQERINLWDAVLEQIKLE